MKSLMVGADLISDGIQREWPDPERPGLVFIIPPEHIWLCPFEVERLRREWDEKRDNSTSVDNG